jgi:signal transduction histidine kinase
MVTAYASLEVAVSATKNGAYDFLAKPFTPDELKSVVKKAAHSLIAQRKARELAADKRRVRFQFISVLAHELKAPLAAVDSYLQLMKRHTAGEDISSYDHIVGRSIIRVEGMRKMILDLLDLTRIESGQKKRETIEINVIDAVQTAIENVTLAAQEREIQINLHSADEILFWADAGEMEMIFNNLVSNAVKYNKDGGSVDIRIELKNNILQIDVSDTGYGMTQEEQERLFGEFVRIKNENTRNVMGSGLGLSILKKIAMHYGGRVSVKSEVEVGSTFSVNLKNEAPQMVAD